MPVKEQWGVLVSEVSPLAAKESIQPSDLNGIPLISTRRALMQRKIDDWLGETSGQIEIVASGNLVYNQAILARDELGAVVTLRLEHQFGGLKFIPFSPALYSDTVLVWKKAQPHSKTAQVFLEHAKKFLRRNRYEIHKLGNSDLNVSRICLGCMRFGDTQSGMSSWTLDEAASREIIRHALESGINFFDMAVGYQGDTSEQYVGRALKVLVKREDVVVATKFPGRSAADIETGISGQKYVEKMLDTSPSNLGMDYVDLYILHMWDYHTPIDEILEVLSNAVKAGKVRAIGISYCYAYQLANGGRDGAEQ